MKKFTFKKHSKEGMCRSFQKDCTDIKLNKKVVGIITELENREYRISLAIKKEKTENNPAPFRWIRLKKRFDNENTARQAANKYAEDIQNKYNLYLFDD